MKASVLMQQEEKTGVLAFNEFSLTGIKEKDLVYS